MPVQFMNLSRMVALFIFSELYWLFAKSFFMGPKSEYVQITVWQIRTIRSFMTFNECGVALSWRNTIHFVSFPGLIDCLSWSNVFAYNFTYLLVNLLYIYIASLNDTKVRIKNHTRYLSEHLMINPNYWTERINRLRIGHIWLTRIT